MTSSTSLFDDELRALARRAVLCWLATVDAEGQPHVSPKEIWALHGEDEVHIAHIASPTTARNLRGHARACLSLVDIWAQRGFKLLGEATVVAPDEAGFSALSAPLRARMPALFPLHGVFRMTVRRVQPILAPSYRHLPGTTEASQRLAARRAYGIDSTHSP